MNICDFVYSVVLKPRPLRLMANACLRTMLPERVVRQGATIVLNQKDPVVSGALALNVYEPEQTSFFLAACEPGSVFLDIGANSGYYTALFLSHAGPRGRAIALEPDPECFEVLQRTVQANGGTNTTCLQLAASDVRGTARLYRNGQNRGDNRLYWHDMATSTCEVRVNKVDSVLAQLQIPEVNLIKMDVQGFEAIALRGMQDTLDRSARLIILSEGILVPIAGGCVAAGGCTQSPESINWVLSPCSLTIKGVPYGAFLSVFAQSVISLLQPPDSIIDGFLFADINAQAGKAFETFEYAGGSGVATGSDIKVYNPALGLGSGAFDASSEAAEALLTGI